MTTRWIRTQPIKFSFQNQRTFSKALIRHKSGSERRRAVVWSMKHELWALDFDGVICDSCGESSISAWKAATKLWPQMISSNSAMNQKDSVLEKMRIIRPVVETGYENIVQIRCLLEGISTESILSDWSSILSDSMQRWDLNRSEVISNDWGISIASKLVELFGSTRDEWMKNDLQGWLAPNRIFEGLPESLPSLFERAEVYIVTTKQERFTYALLKDMAQIDFPTERILSTTVSGQPKTEILHELQKQHDLSECYFIEDKLSTLNKVCQDRHLDHWVLYLADWGYNTEEERFQAQQNPRIQILSLNTFASLLKRPSKTTQ